MPILCLHVQGGVLWDVFLYAVDMSCSHRLINKVALAYGKAGESKPRNLRRDTGKEGKSLGDSSQLLRKQDM